MSEENTEALPPPLPPPPPPPPPSVRGGGSGGESLRVAIRLRPLKDSEGACAWQYDCEDGTVALLGPDGVALGDKKSSFRYDAVFGEQAQTSEIYDVVIRDLVDGVLHGVNGTVFAYGQTAAGKT